MKKHFKVLLWSLIVNSFLVIIKVIVGYIGHSKSLIADAIHSFSDLITDVISMIGIKLSNSKADREHPYGHGRLEYLVSIGVGIAILVLGIGLLRTSIFSSITIPSIIVVYVIVGDIIIKNFLSRYIIKKGREYKSSILVSNGLESQSDVISSIVVLLSFIGSKLTNVTDIFKYSDKVGGIIVSGFILYIGYKILKANIISILGNEETDEVYLKEVRDFIMKMDGVLSVNKISIQKYGTYNKAILEIGVDPNIPVIKAHKISHIIEDKLIKGKFRISYVTVHIEDYEIKE